LAGLDSTDALRRKEPVSCHRVVGGLLIQVADQLQGVWIAHVTLDGHHAELTAVVKRNLDLAGCLPEVRSRQGLACGERRRRIKQPCRPALASHRFHGFVQREMIALDRHAVTGQPGQHRDQSLRFSDCPTRAQTPPWRVETMSGRIVGCQHTSIRDQRRP